MAGRSPPPSCPARALLLHAQLPRRLFGAGVVDLADDGVEIHRLGAVRETAGQLHLRMQLAVFG